MMDERDQPVWTYEDLGILLGAVLPCLVLAALGAKLLTIFVPQKGVVTAISQMLIYIGVSASLYMMLTTKYSLDFWKAMDFRIQWRRMALTALIGPALAFCMALLAVVLRTPQDSTMLDALMTDRWSILAIGLTATTAGPVFEELIFRGFAQPLFVRSLGLLGGLLATAIPFALLHGVQNNWVWQRLLILALASMVFGLVRQKTGSTAASSLTHAAYNLTFMAGLIFKEMN